ncbi:PRC-barrel domain-containing protein [Methanobrevibacter sp.]|uniref:PRC-barrel domain-containing protein n=1 Tax=Methanobrevibacter sp. TaxID=66852 RepID=UPI00388E2D82
MHAKQFFGITVLDKNVKAVGKVEDIDIDTETGDVTSLIISLNKGLFSNDAIEVEFENIDTIGDYILLDTEIVKEEEVEEEDEEPEKVTVEVEEE